MLPSSSTEYERPKTAAVSAVDYPKPIMGQGQVTATLLEAAERIHLVCTEADMTWSQAFDRIQMKLEPRFRNDLVVQVSTSRHFKVQKERFHLMPPTAQEGGKKRAVLIGINYGKILKNSHKSVNLMKNYLSKYEKVSSITILADDGVSHQPTRKTIFRSIQKLVADSQPGDSALVQFVGLGGSLRETSSTKKNSMQESTWMPVDFQTGGHIREKYIFQYLFCAMKPGVCLTCVVDCGSDIGNLPYLYKALGDKHHNEMIRQEGGFAIDLVLGGIVFAGVAGGLIAASNAGGGDAGGDCGGGSCDDCCNEVDCGELCCC